MGLEEIKKLYFHLLLTSTSTKSRNYTFGVLIGKKDINKSKEFLNTTTVEGYNTLKSIYKLIKKKKIDTPIINIIYKIVIKGSDPNLLSEFLIKKA